MFTPNDGKAERNNAWSELGDEKYVSLTTFKRNGEGVASAMWADRDGENLSVWTPADSWKVRRAKRDPRVTLAICGRSGTVSEDATVCRSSAAVITESHEVERVKALIKVKYGLECRVLRFIEALTPGGRKPRLVLRLTPANS